MIDPNTAMSAAGEAAKTSGKLADIIQKVFGPNWTKKQADADAYSTEIKMKQIRDNPDMDLSFIDGVTNIRGRTPDELLHRAELRKAIESIKQEKNIENVLEFTNKNLADSEETSDASVDEDWIARFFSIVRDVSTEEMQLIWGKLLADEIKAPGSFSLRTLETIRNMTKKEALAFQKIVPLVLWNMDNGELGYALVSDDSLLRTYDITFNDIQILDESGLIISNGFINLNYTIGEETNFTLFNDKYAISVRMDKGQREESIGIFPLTRAGRELCKILNMEPNFSYIRDLANYIQKKNADQYIVEVFGVNAITKDTINYSRNSLLVVNKTTSYDQL